ncbi:MAG: AI-2E family transporter [Rikenellaceae bacterium]
MNVSREAIVKFFIGLAVVAAVAYLFWFFSTVVIYILISAVLAVMFRPLVSTLSESTISTYKIPRGVASALTLFVIWAIFAIFVALFLPLVFSKTHQLVNLDISQVIRSVEEPLLHVQHYIQGVLSLPETNISLSDSIVSAVREFVDYDSINRLLTSAVSTLASSVIAFFSISFITFFFLKEDGLFFNMVRAIFPDRYEDNVTRALGSTTYLLSRYFVGILGESLILTCVISFALFCFGMGGADALSIGLVMGVLNVIPYAGPFMGVMISLFLGVVTPIEALGIGGTVFTILATLMTVKGLDDFILQPTLYSERVKAHPLEVFIVILMAGYVAGILGMLLAIPSYTVLRVFAKEFFSQFSLVQKLTKEI